MFFFPFSVEQIELFSIMCCGTTAKSLFLVQAFTLIQHYYHHLCDFNMIVKRKSKKKLTKKTDLEHFVKRAIIIAALSTLPAKFRLNFWDYRGHDCFTFWCISFQLVNPLTPVLCSLLLWKPEPPSPPGSLSVLHHFEDILLTYITASRSSSQYFTPHLLFLVVQQATTCSHPPVCGICPWASYTG